MSDLVEFLLARLAEEEAVAWDACRTPGRRWVREAIGHVNDENGDIVVFSDGTTSREQADHIARQDPARVLRQVEAMRAVVALHVPKVGDHLPRQPICAECGGSTWKPESADRLAPFPWVMPWPCPTLRLIASIWAGHRDYRQEWAS